MSGIGRIYPQRESRETRKRDTEESTPTIDMILDGAAYPGDVITRPSTGEQWTVNAAATGFVKTGFGLSGSGTLGGEVTGPDPATILVGPVAANVTFTPGLTVMNSTFIYSNKSSQLNKLIGTLAGGRVTVGNVDYNTQIIGGADIFLSPNSGSVRVGATAQNPTDVGANDVCLSNATSLRGQHGAVSRKLATIASDGTVQLGDAAATAVTVSSASSVSLNSIPFLGVMAVAALPVASSIMLAYASDARCFTQDTFNGSLVLETAGNGTGSLVQRRASDGVWVLIGTTIVAVA